MSHREKIILKVCLVFSYVFVFSSLFISCCLLEIDFLIFSRFLDGLLSLLFLLLALPFLLVSLYLYRKDILIRLNDISDKLNKFDKGG